MKNIHILFFSLFTSVIFSQNNAPELLTKNKITKIIIQGYEYQDNSLIKQTYHVNDIDNYGNTTAFKTYDLNDSLITETNYKISDDGKTRYSTTLDEKGAVNYSHIITKDYENRSIRRLQLNAEGDTLVHQLRIRDKNLKDSILYNIIKNKRIVSYTWNYNDGGMLISKAKFDKNGNLINKDFYTYHINGNCVKMRNENRTVVSNKCIEGNKEIRKFSTNRKGYMSGIKLVLEKGGKSIETRLDNGLVEKKEYFSKKGKLLALLKYTYH